MVEFVNESLDKLLYFTVGGVKVLKLNEADFPKELVELVEEAMKSNITKEDFKIFLKKEIELLKN